MNELIGTTTPLAFVWRSSRALARHPSLWATAIRSIFRLAPHGWWKRWPFIPVPPAGLLAFRGETMYGHAAALPPPEDLIGWLRWCRAQR